MDFNNAQNNFSLGKLAGKILRKWYWLALSIALCLAAAYTVNRYTVPLYKVSASVFVKNKDPFSAQAMLLEQDGDGGPSKNLYNEKYFLKSRTLIETAMRELDFGVSYFKQTDTITIELYKKSPIEVLPDTSSKLMPYYESITCTILSPKKYALAPKSDWFKPHFEGKQFNFGQTYDVNGFKFTIQLDQPIKTLNEEIVFHINSFEGLVDEYKDKLTVETEAKEASIIILSTVGRSPSKERAFLNKLMDKFVERDLEEKNQATALTSRFIDNLLASNIDTLNRSKQDITRERIVAGTNNVGTKYAELRNQIRELEDRREAMQMSIGFANHLLDQLRRNADVSQIAIPAGLGVESPQLSANLTELRTLQEEIADLPSRNPLRVEKEARMRELETAIRSNITALRQATNIQLGVVNTRIASAEALLRQVPKTDILLADIEQTFQTNQSMVNYLLQKKAEAGIAHTTVTSNYKPVDLARTSASMMDPMKNYITALLVGLLVPIAVIVLKDSFNNKLVTKRDLQNNSSLPLLGIIGYDGAREKAISYSYKASLTAESFRSVRTNLGYFIDADENAASDSAKVLLFVSSISREGKTYCSKYLSFVLSLSGKKTLLINADMRKPDRNDDLEAEGFTGLSHYLSGKATIDEIILRTKGDNLFYVKSGEVPPNPSELLIAPRMQHLIDTVKASFDYIIIDTPPIGAFSDSVVLLKYADLSICVVRQNHTTRPLLENLNELHQNNPHIKMALLFNYVDMKKLDAGYRRSYYNAEYYQAAAKPSWWKRLTA